MINTTVNRELRIYEISTQYLWVGATFSMPLPGKYGCYVDTVLTLKRFFPDTHPGVEKGYVWLDVVDDKGRAYGCPMLIDERVYIRMP